MGGVETDNWQEVLIELEGKEEESASEEVGLLGGGCLFEGDEVFEGKRWACEYCRHK